MELTHDDRNDVLGITTASLLDVVARDVLPEASKFSFRPTWFYVLVTQIARTYIGQDYHVRTKDLQFRDHRMIQNLLR